MEYPLGRTVTNNSNSDVRALVHGMPEKSHVYSTQREKTGLGSSSDSFGGLEPVGTGMTTFDMEPSDALYRDGQLVKQPAPSGDPRDPLNLTMKRKLLLAVCLCFFGALAAAAELILGAMLPIFALLYANIDPKMLLPFTESASFLPVGSDPLAVLSELPNAPPITKIYLLASLPILMIGISNLFLIPAAIIFGRRPVIVFCGIVAIGGAIWAGSSQSLDSHLAARAFQAFGAGTVESLIPFIIQDIVFVHERNTWISGIFAAQGIIIISIGFASPYMVIYWSWRWVYYITAIVAAVFLVGVVLFMPETRWHRTRSEMKGQPRDERGAIYAQRTWKYDLALFHGEVEWRKGYHAILDTLLSFFYPHIFFITMLNSAMIATALAAAYTAAAALLVKPWSWPFLHLGFILIPVLISAILVGIITGKLADWTANQVARRRGKRIPENQLLNLILPTFTGLIGSILFGLAGADPSKYPWIVFMVAIGLMTFGFLGANTVGAVYVLECYPHLAGPALVNIASFRCLIAFVLSFKVSEWIATMGYFNSMMVYTGVTAAFALLLPLVYVYGPAWRKRWPADRMGDRRED